MENRNVVWVTRTVQRRPGIDFSWPSRDVTAARTRYSCLSDAMLAGVLHGTSDCSSGG